MGPSGVGPTRLSSRAERPASQPAGWPPGPQPSESQRARGGIRPPASRAFAPRSPKRPPLRHSVRQGTDPDPGPRLRHRGLRHWPTRPQVIDMHIKLGGVRRDWRDSRQLLFSLMCNYCVCSPPVILVHCYAIAGGSDSLSIHWQRLNYY
jgi:hypothetical protein